MSANRRSVPNAISHALGGGRAEALVPHADRGAAVVVQAQARDAPRRIRQDQVDGAVGQGLQQGEGVGKAAFAPWLGRSGGGGGGGAGQLRRRGGAGFSVFGPRAGRPPARAHGRNAYKRGRAGRRR